MSRSTEFMNLKELLERSKTLTTMRAHKRIELTLIESELDAVSMEITRVMNSEGSC